MWEFTVKIHVLKHSALPAMVQNVHSKDLPPGQENNSTMIHFLLKKKETFI